MAQDTPIDDAVLASCPVPALRVQGETILYSNPAIVEVLTALEPVAGQPLGDFLVSGEAADDERPRVSVVRRVDGQTVPVHARFHPLPGTDQRIVWLSPLPPTVPNQPFFEMASRTASDILASHTGVEALTSFAEAARRLVGARYGAIGVASADGQSLDEFITVGLSDAAERAIGERPAGAGVLGLLLRRDTPLRIARLADHPGSRGFPANHPPMESFLGVPIRHDGTVLGSLYLTDKAGGFSHEDEVTIDALSIHLAVAIRNLHLLKRQRALVAGLISAQEEERRAVAYDLHDGLTQYVMGAYAHLQSFRATEASGEVDLAQEEFNIGLRYLNEAVVESRRLVNGLRTLALDDMGLAGALEQLVFEEKARAGWQSARVEHDLSDARFNQTLQTAVYRIGQEALTNARKHAGAQRVEVTLRIERPRHDALAWLVLTVEDDGVGFDPAQVESHGNRVGLHGMAERARLLEGALSVDSTPGLGTRLQARLPMYTPEIRLEKDTPDV